MLLLNVVIVKAQRNVSTRKQVSGRGNNNTAGFHKYGYKYMINGLPYVRRVSNESL